MKIDGKLSPDWANPNVLSRNAEPPRASFIPYGDRDTALAGERGASPFYLLLNGNCKFHYAATPDAAPELCDEQDGLSERWNTILVPSNYADAGVWETALYEQQIPVPG